MAVTWRFEVWTHPRLGTPSRVVGSLPFTRAQLADREDAIVDSWIEIPAARRSDIEALLNIDPTTMANSKSRIIRAYRVDTVDPVPVDGGGNPLPDHEFVAADLTFRIVEPGMQLAKIAGPDLRGAPDEAAVLAYDYPKQPATARDWQWNGPNLFDNGDLENLSVEIQSFYIEGIGAGDTYTVTFDGQTTSALTWGADANVRLAELETALEALSNLVDVEIIGEGTLLDPFEILFVDPGGEDLPLITVTPSVGTATRATISTGGFPSIEGWTKAYNPVTGQEFGAYTDFRSTSPDLSETGLNGSDGALIMTIPAGADSRFAGGQVILSVTPGSLLQLSIDAECSSTVDTFRFVVRDLIGDTESRLKSTPELSFAAAGVAETFTLDDVKVRPNVDRVLVRFAITTPGGPATSLQLKLDNLVVQEGFRGTTKGGIVETLHTDLSVSHAPRTRLDWLSLGFGVVNDSSGTPWAEADLPYVVRHGMRFGSHVLGGLQDLGSLWDLVPLTPTTWRLDLWDEANKGTDHSTDPAIAFLIGQISDGAIQHRLPAETVMMAVGEGGVWAEVEDPDLVAAFGPIDGYVENTDWLDVTTVTAAATEHLAREAQNALSVKAVTSSSKGAIPWKQVRVSDRATFTLGTVAKHTRRIRQCTVTITPDSWSAEWVASRVFIGESATQEAIRRILTAWDRRQFTDRPGRQTVPAPTTFPGGQLGQPVIVAASDSPAAWKAVAHFTCTGTSSNPIDRATIEAAIEFYTDVVFDSAFVLLAPGNFWIETDGGPIIAARAGGNTILGSGVGATFLNGITSTDSGDDRVIMSASSYSYVAGLAFVDYTGLVSGLTNVTVSGINLGDQCEYSTIERVHGFGTGFLVDSASPGSGAFDVQIVDCYSEFEGGLLRFRDNGVDTLVVTNVVVDRCFAIGGATGILVDTNRVQITDLMIRGCNFRGCEAAIVADVSGTSTLAGLSILDPTLRLLTAANRTQIRLVDVSGFEIRGGRIVFAVNPSATTDGIEIAGTYTGGKISDVTAVPPSTATNARYAINPSSASASGLIVVGNDLRGTWGTAPINVTNSPIVDHPDDATYGDNWT